jgi:hypothetical protein
MKRTVMKQRKNRKPTNKDFQEAIQEIRYRLATTQSQLNALTEIFSDFLDYTHKKAKFMEYLQNKSEQNRPGSVKNPEVKQKEAEPA